MKKLILPLALLALTIALPSCDNDDDSPRVVNPTAVPPVIEGGKLISYHESAVPEDGVVTLDEKIVEIGAAAFAGNTKVKEIHASKVTKIDSAAFSGATSLALVDFSASANPPAATADAFYNTPSTKAIKLPASPNALNWFEFAARHDFGFFQGLEETAKSNYTAKDGVLTAIDGKKLGVQGLLVLPESVTKIADGVGFADKGVKLVYAPGVTEMGSGVFNQAENLRGIIAPRLKKIGTMAFVQTAALPVINFPELTEIGPLSFDNHDNRARLELTLLRLPKIQKIGNGAFTDRFGSLTTFILGAKPTYNTAAAKAPVIDDDAFEDWMIIDGGFDDYLFATFKGRRAAGATLLVPAANLADYGAEGAQWEGFTIKVLK